MTKEVVPTSAQAAFSKAPRILKELQGLTQSLLAGTTANTTIALAAIRAEDTILSALNNNAGTITDITANISINALKATGTVTCASVDAGDTVTIDGRVYTAIANGATPANSAEFSVSTTNTLCAANLVAAIIASEKNDTTSKVTASNAAGVVTITARAEGTGGNAITLTSSDGTDLAVSGATLSGGSATGGIKSTSITNQIILMWYNKNA
jgi:phage tail sheath gpL-like